MTDDRAGELSGLLEELIGRTRAAGADAADAVGVAGRSLGVSWRMGAPEDIERSEEQGIGLRALIGRRQATVSSADLSPRALEALVERVVAMARAAPEDPHAGLADPALLAVDTDSAALEIFDPAKADEAMLTEMAREAEDAARSVPGVTNSGGAGAGAGSSLFVLATSSGFSGCYRGSNFSVGVSVLAGDGGGMERDYEQSSTRQLADLESPLEIGRRAGERAVARLGARQPATGRMPVVFDPRVASSLIGHFAQAINGIGIARGTSFLKNEMGKRVFAPGVFILDDARRKRGLASRPFDAEGVAVRPLGLVADGMLESWILDTATAHKLGLASTGHARRDLSGPPSPGSSNLWLAAGALTRAELLESVGHGVYVTELIGMGVNPVTGDYSRGAAGFLIEQGEIGRPVSEFTIAGNLKEMFRHLLPASDLEFRHAIDAPTVRVDGMTVAGG